MSKKQAKKRVSKRKEEFYVADVDGFVLSGPHNNLKLAQKDAQANHSDEATMRYSNDTLYILKCVSTGSVHTNPRVTWK